MITDFGFDDGMFSDTQKIKFHGFKNGEHRFRVLPPFAPGKLYHQVDLHWGYTDENGGKKAIMCTKFSHKTCAMCDEVDRLKSEVEMIKNNSASYNSIEEANEAIKEKELRISDVKKKPTYLWNILTEDGGAKVLQLSWNGHEPLLNKVKFLWEVSKINITDLKNNQQMWCSRTGQNAKTRYQYELVGNSARALENVNELIDLTKVYKTTTPSEIKAIVERGYVGNAKEDPNDRDFTASMPSGVGGNAPATNTTANAPVNQPAVNNAPTNPPAAETPVTQTNVASNPVTPSPTTNVNVDNDIAKMQSILNG